MDRAASVAATAADTTGCDCPLYGTTCTLGWTHRKRARPGAGCIAEQCHGPSGCPRKACILTELNFERLNLVLQHHVLNLGARNVGAISRPSCEGAQPECKAEKLRPDTVTRAGQTARPGPQGTPLRGDSPLFFPFLAAALGGMLETHEWPADGLGQRLQRAAEQMRCRQPALHSADPRGRGPVPALTGPLGTHT